MSINKDLESKFLSFLNVDKIETEEDFNNFTEAFNQKFVPKETAHEYDDVKAKVIGKRMGEINSQLVAFGKAIGQDVSYEKLKEKKVEEVLSDFSNVVSTRFQELESKAKDGHDKKLNDLQKELEEKSKSVTSYKEALEQVQTQLQEKESQFTNEIKNFKIQTKLKDVKASVNWVDGITDVQRAGFDTIIGSNYRFDLDENDNVVVTDKDGKLIPLKDKAGAFADVNSVFASVAEQNGLVKKNNLDYNKKVVTFVNEKTEETGTKKVTSAYELRRQELGI